MKWERDRQCVSELKETCERGDRKRRRVKRERIPREQCPLNQLSKAPMSSQTLRQQTQGSHRLALDSLTCIKAYSFCVFMGILNVWISGSLILVPTLGGLCILLVCLAHLLCDRFCFILFYLILLCFIMIY